MLNEANLQKHFISVLSNSNLPHKPVLLREVVGIFSHFAKNSGANGEKNGGNANITIIGAKKARKNGTKNDEITVQSWANFDKTASNSNLSECAEKIATSYDKNFGKNHDFDKNKHAAASDFDKNYAKNSEPDNDFSSNRNFNENAAENHDYDKNPAARATILDCTLGYGGHSEALLDAGFDVIACDQDQMALAYCREKFATQLHQPEPATQTNCAQLATAATPAQTNNQPTASQPAPQSQSPAQPNPNQPTAAQTPPRITILHSDFASIIPALPPAQRQRIRGVLADIGVSSLQLDLDERGFGADSGALDMRMNAANPLTARAVINDYPREKLEHVLRDYGELPNARALTAKIIARRPIHTARELAQIIGDGRLFGRGVRLWTLVFQAVRIEVNDELGQLGALLERAKTLRGTVLCVISFHSLEDRIVKEHFKSWQRACVCEPGALRCTCGGANALGEIITKKPLTAQPDELALNPRASCAKLRAFRFF